jgi:hypothetical protein
LVDVEVHPRAESLIENEALEFFVDAIGENRPPNLHSSSWQ